MVIYQSRSLREPAYVRMVSVSLMNVAFVSCTSAAYHFLCTHGIEQQVSYEHSFINILCHFIETNYKMSTTSLPDLLCHFCKDVPDPAMKVYQSLCEEDSCVRICHSCIMIQ